MLFNYSQEVELKRIMKYIIREDGPATLECSGTLMSSNQ